jgi:hypothetical protein
MMLKKTGESLTGDSPVQVYGWSATTAPQLGLPSIQ